MGGHNTGVTIILGFIAILLLIAVVLFAVILFVIFRYRVPLRGIAALAGAYLYFVSPIDAIPDFLGPIGMVDDVGVLGAAAYFVYRLIQARNQVQPSGPESGPGSGRGSGPGVPRALGPRR